MPVPFKYEQKGNQKIMHSTLFLSGFTILHKWRTRKCMHNNNNSLNALFYLGKHLKPSSTGQTCFNIKHILLFLKRRHK